VTCTAFRIFSAKPRVEPPRAERPWSTVIFGLMTSEIALLTRLRAFGADVRVFAKFVDRFRSPHISAKVLMVWEIAEGRRVLECPVLSGCRWFCRRARGGRFFWGEPGRGGAPARRVSRRGGRFGCQGSGLEASAAAWGGSPDAVCPPIDYRYWVDGNELRGMRMRWSGGVIG
jgi:hypothetical protein